MEPTVRAILCPCCRRLLYALEPAAAGWRLTQESPGLREDRQGPFMQCRHCSRRVAIVRNPHADPPVEVARDQKCDDPQ